RARHIGKRAAIGGRSVAGGLGALARLLLLPDARKLTRIGGNPWFLEYVRVAADELFADVVGDRGEVEPTLLLGHAGMKHHLEEQIAELLAQLVRLATLDGIGDFVRLFDGVGRNGAKRLLAIPGTAALRVAQPCHQRKERGQLLPGRAAAAQTRPSVHSL